jgi:hypothetical protein
MVPSSVGIASDTRGWPVMSEAKIRSLDNFCYDNMDLVTEMLDVDYMRNGLAIGIYKFDGDSETVMASCGSVPGSIPSSSITRIGISDADGDIIRIVVTYF